MNETESKLIDHIDLMKDEFLRIKALTNDAEIVQLCNRAVNKTDQLVPVLTQRDEAESKLRRLIVLITAYKMAGGSARRKALRALVEAPILD